QRPPRRICGGGVRPRPQGGGGGSPRQGEARPAGDVEGGSVKDPFKEKIALASMAFAEMETWAREKELLCRICVRDKPKWLPRWIYQKVLERIIVVHEFEPCVRCRCGHDMSRVIL